MLKLSLKNLEMIAHGNAGAIASLISTCILFPCENIKTRMHIVSKEESKQQDDKTDDIKRAQNFDGVSNTIRRVLREEGVAGLYKGITPLLLGNYLSYGVYFFWYEFFKHKLQTNTNGGVFASIKPSFLSAVLTTVITNPFWVIQSKQTFSKDQLNFVRTCQKMVRTEGFLSFFKGLEASLVLVINPIIQFLGYELIKRKFKDFPYQSFIHFFGGAISKAVATLVTYPYQVLRTYAHIDKGKTDYLELLGSIYQKLGLQGFFRGLTPKLVQTVLNSAFMLMFYEYLVRLIKQLAMRLVMRYYRIK